MGADFAASAGAEDPGTAANSSTSGGCRRSALHFADGVSVASAAARFSEAVDRAALFLCVAGGWAVGKGQFPVGPTGSGAGWPRSQPLGRGDRQSIGQHYGKRRSAGRWRRQEEQRGQGPKTSR